MAEVRLHLCPSCGKVVCEVRDSGKLVFECSRFCPIENGPTIKRYIVVEEDWMAANPGDRVVR
jgi:hypothetical protein